MERPSEMICGLSRMTKMAAIPILGQFLLQDQRVLVCNTVYVGPTM